MAADIACDFYTAVDPKMLSSDYIALLFDAEGVSLQLCGKKVPGPVRADFVAGKLGYRRQPHIKSQQGLPDIAKAVGVKKSTVLSVLDVTAGMGQDAFILADLGCQVTLLERSPLVFTLLSDAVARANKVAATSDAELLQTLGRMQLLCADGLNYLRNFHAEQKPAVIYIDPMFPEKTKSALANKTMQVFHSVVGADADSDQLLELALATAEYRVVVKRPLRADFLAQRQPSLQVKGKAVRFDVYPLKKLP